MIQTGITRLLELFPDRDCSPLLVDEYNRRTRLEYERVRDFLVLHYHANERAEPMWRDCAHMQVPDSLAWKMEHFRAYGRFVSEGPEVFAEPSWLAVYIGQGVLPRGHDPLADARDGAEVLQRLAAMRQLIAAAAGSLPSHRQFIDRYCKARLDG